MSVVRFAVLTGADRWVCTSCQTQIAKRIQRTCHTQSRQSSTSTTKAKLPDIPARTRFAPSPTGSLHLGSIRTALFNYLLAKRTGGQFLLRLEDTDRKRTVPGAEERLYDDLRWANLHWDEGPIVGGPYGPYRQSERTETYRDHVKPLLDRGSAYRCFCSHERLNDLNRLRHEKGLALGYDRRCTNIPKVEADERAHNGETHVIRFKVPKTYPMFQDIVYGKTGHGFDKQKKHQLEDAVYDDPILLKSDSHPTYHFANVIDDHLMKITHVIRGSEWMASTPLHMALYQALNWSPPSFGHVPLLVDENKQKLSKRNFNSDIAIYRDAGYFPDALTNFAALLGWSHRQKSDVMDLQELEGVFDLKFTKGNTIVSLDKLTYLQEQHARRRIVAGDEEFEQMIRDVAAVMLEKYGAAYVAKFVGNRSFRDVAASMLRAESIPYRSAADFVQRCSMLLADMGHRPQLEMPDISLVPAMRAAAASLCLVPTEHWNRETHRANLALLDLSQDQDDLQSKKRSKKELYHYLRWALLGGQAGPSIPETMEVLGRDICNARIMDAALISRDVENMATKPDLTTKFRHSQSTASA